MDSPAAFSSSSNPFFGWHISSIWALLLSKEIWITSDEFFHSLVHRLVSSLNFLRVEQVQIDWKGPVWLSREKKAATKFQDIRHLFQFFCYCPPQRIEFESRNKTIFHFSLSPQPNGLESDDKIAQRLIFLFFLLLALLLSSLSSSSVPLPLMTSPRGYGMHLEHHIKALGERKKASH